MTFEQKYTSQTLIESLESLSKEYRELNPGNLPGTFCSKELNDRLENLRSGAILISTFYKTKFKHHYSEKNISETFNSYNCFLARLTRFADQALKDDTIFSLGMILIDREHIGMRKTTLELFIKSAKSDFQELYF